MPSTCRVEDIAAAITGWFPDAQVSRTRDVFQIDIDGERGCVVLATSDGLELRLPTVEWRAVYDPCVSSHFWKRVPVRRVSDSLKAHIEEAIAARVSMFQQCAICGNSFSPEHMTGDACHGCSSEHRGIVY